MTEASAEHRYERLDEKNTHSWYMTENDRPFTVIQSIHSAGPPRVNPDGVEVVPKTPDFQKELNRAVRNINQLQVGGRFELGGNMSSIRQPGGKTPYGPSELNDDERHQNAIDNMLQHFEAIGVDPATVRVLFPERTYIDHPMSIVNADKDTGVYQGGEPLRLQEPGDFVYTYNPDIVLAARPADCPIAFVAAETPKGRVDILIHFAWRGPATGQMEDVRKAFEDLGVDYDSMRVYITAGGHAETYRFAGYVPDDTKENPEPTSDRLFLNKSSRVQDDGTTAYDFGIDVTNEVYESFKDLGLTDEQLFVDTTDTTSLESGTASHGRAVRLHDDNVRDIVTAQFEHTSSKVLSNPNRPTPPEIEWQIIPLRVEYIDFDGNKQVGEIEINRMVADEVAAFFAKALEMGFPIEKVVKSSDVQYGWDDSKLLADNASSGFNYRLIKGTTKPSKHGKGLAFDINTRVNPYILFTPNGPDVDPPGATYDPEAKGALTADHPLVILMKELGWEWGGDWREEVNPQTGEPTGRTDYQHFGKILPEDSVS